MKTISKIAAIFTLLTLMFCFNGCETTELDLRDDPNLLVPGQADPQLVLNAMQISYRDFLNSQNLRTMDYTRMTQQFGPYNTDPALFDPFWRNAYSRFLQDAKVMIPIAEERELFTHSGIAKVLKAHVITVLVDIFGDVPYTEANQGTNFPNPALDSGAELYQEALNLLDEALIDLSQEAPLTTGDLYYNNNKSQWIKLANSLKLKLYLQTRLVNPSESANGINQLLNENNLINTAADDFVFKYSTTSTPVQSRHPLYVSNYNNGTPTGWFMSNNFMFYLKSTDDPRIRYYFYRQRIDDPTPNNLPCLTQNFDYCYIGDGYFGRDHADDTFTDAQMHQRNTTWGVYPVGGKFDNDSGGVTNQTTNRGAEGQGISPILLSSFVNFMKAEAALTLGTSGDAANYLETALNHSIDKTLSFGNLGINDDTGFRPTPAEVQVFISGVMSDFTAASTTDKLDILMKQYLIALWGNGLEAYNNYRRTGLPSDIQSPQFPAGPFPRVFQYPTEALLNSSIQQQLVTETVFWDTNPTNFID